MFELFGVSLTINELIGIIGMLSGGVAAYYNLNKKVDEATNKIAGVEERNRRADDTTKAIQQELVNRISNGEERIRSQELAWVRVDERLASMQSVLEEIRNRAK